MVAESKSHNVLVCFGVVLNSMFIPQFLIIAGVWVCAYFSITNELIDGRHESPYVVAYTFHFVAETNSPFSPLDSCCFNTSHTYVCCVYPENNTDPASSILQFISYIQRHCPFFQNEPCLPLFLWFQTFVETSNVLFHSVSLDFPQNKPPRRASGRVPPSFWGLATRARRPGKSFGKAEVSKL